MKKGEIVKIVLAGLAVAGVIAVAAAAPNAFAAFGSFYKPARGLSSWQIKRTLKRLQEKKLVGMSKEGDKTVVRLTKSGRLKVLKYKLEELAIKPLKRWDHKFRLVIFDIPKEYKYRSSVFSRKLKELGFALLQKSVWVCPYPCEDEIDFLKEVYEIKPFVRLVTAEKIDLQQDLIRKFNLN